jgi:4-diphosphocytidyl-2-C-methyl-D-erythritol kinase
VTASPWNAPAKLTLTLRVLGTLPDGFHELEALTVSLDAPLDTLTISRSMGALTTVQVTGPACDGVPADGTNLAVRAAERVLPAGVHLAIAIEKEIPAGAGLGGGSSDAAAVLRYCVEELGVDAGSAHDAAAALGSDIPFCLHGGPAWMRGRGERLEPVDLPEPVVTLVAVPPFRLATPDVYRAWDELGGPAGRRVAPPPTLDGLVDELVNDLEPAAERVAPPLAEFRATFEAAAGAPALLAGSGSACWVPFTDVGDAQAARARVEASLGVAAFVGVSR